MGHNKHHAQPQRPTLRRALTLPRALHLGLLGCLLFGLLGAAGAAQQSLESIGFSALPGDRVRISLTFSGSASVPRSFTTDNPARIALDFPNTRNALPSRSTEIGIGVAHSVSAVEAGGRTRVVLNLVRLVPFETRAEGNDVVLVLGSTGGAEAAAPARPSAPAPSAPAADSAAGPVVSPTAQAQPYTGHRLEDVDFRRGEDGEARILVTLSDPGVVVDIREEGGRLLVDFLDTALPPRLERRLDVVDFATPARLIDTFTADGNVRMAIETMAEYEHLAYQSANRLTLELRPITAQELAEQRKERFGYTGDRLSLNFHEIDIRAALQVLADFTGLNVVVSDTVQGNLTLRLKNVPWDQVLDLILTTKGLDKRQAGNVLLIAPATELAAREKEIRESQKEVREAAPTRSEFIQVNYAKASEIADLLQSGDTTLLSPQGKVSVDERTNTLLVQDTAAKLSEIRRLVTTLDIPVRQVLIDSRIVIADKGFSRDLGVRFGFTGVDTVNGDLITTTGSGGEDGIDEILDSALENKVDTGNFFPVQVPADPQDRFNVNLPAVPGTGAPGRLALAILSDKFLLDLELSALQAESRGEIISNPRVITADQRQAVIKQGEEIPFQQATSSGATSISFKEAVLKLEVTPHITPDDRIRLELVVSQDSRGQDTPSGPAINKQEVNTEVLVDNGDTVVLGGVYQQTKSNSVNKVPLLGDLPVLGYLFRNKTKVDNQRELLIFVTPRILKESLSLE
jgi:type IV pilus assembly protein PilQ